MTLKEIAEKVLLDGQHEEPWHLFRLQNYPGLDDDKAAAKVAKWAVKENLEIDFDTRSVDSGTRNITVIYVLFTVRQ